MYDARSPARRSRSAERFPLPVVVGDDGSLWGRAALEWAAEHASRTRAVLDVRLWEGTSAEPDAGLNHVTSRFPLLRVHVHESGPTPRGTWRWPDGPQA